MTADRTTLRRFAQWLPLLAWVAICVAWWSPLGVVVGLAVCVVLGVVLQRLDLAGDAVGGARLRSQLPGRLAECPPTHDVLLESAEVGMGGPVYSVQMLRDGAIVEGVAILGSNEASCGWTSLPGSALRLATGSVDRNEGVIVYDEQHKMVHLLAVAPSVLAQELGARRQSDGDAAAALWLRSLPCRLIQLHPCRGLWLAEGHPALAAGVPKALRHVLPDARVLQAIPMLPEDLRLTAHPALFTRLCPYSLHFEGEATGRHVCDLETVITSPSGRCVVVAGSVMDADLRPHQSVWLVYWRERWQAIAGHAVGGRGKSTSMVWINVIEVSDDGTLHGEAHEDHWVADAIKRIPTPHTALELPVEWRQTGLALRVRDGRFTLRLP